MPEPIRDVCSYCGRPIEYLTEIPGQEYWVHVDRMYAHGLIPCRPAVDDVPHVELARGKTGEPLMFAKTSGGTIVGQAAMMPGGPGLWVAVRGGTDEMQANLTESTAWRLLDQWAREAS